MYCPKCGAHAETQIKYCRACGQVLRSRSPALVDRLPQFVLRRLDRGLVERYRRDYARKPGLGRLLLGLYYVATPVLWPHYDSTTYHSAFYSVLFGVVILFIAAWDRMSYNRKRDSRSSSVATVSAETTESLLLSDPVPVAPESSVTDTTTRQLEVLQDKSRD